MSAACRGRGELFFARPRERPELRERREAENRALCSVCQGVGSGREWAREHREYGFWGGQSEEERATAWDRVDIPVGPVARYPRGQVPDVTGGVNVVGVVSAYQRMDAMTKERVAQITECLEGRHVSVALADGSRIDDCELVSAGHQGVQSLWLYSNGADTFVPLVDVTDLWEVIPAGPSHVA